MLGGAAQMFQFAHQNRAQIESDLAEIELDNPILVSMIDKDELAEDAIIIRSAIADSFQHYTNGMFWSSIGLCANSMLLPMRQWRISVTSWMLISAWLRRY
jgi:hypothetical protein